MNASPVRHKVKAKFVAKVAALSISLALCHSNLRRPKALRTCSAVTGAGPYQKRRVRDRIAPGLSRSVPRRRVRRSMKYEISDISLRSSGFPSNCATLCYMNKSDSVGVRELRQNLSVYLRRVAAGEKLRVTERGRTVAALVPLREDESPVERLIKQGRLKPPQGDLLKLGPPSGRPSTRASKTLDELRQERL